MSRDTKRTWSWSEQVEESIVENVILNIFSKAKKAVELETDPAILQRRQKQIDYGKNTVGYANFTQQVPTEQRTKEHPKTPDKYTKYSRRGWDMLIKIWRKKLHEFDTEENDGNDNNGDGGDDECDDDPSPSENSAID
ncbi:Histone RNA hairpin-binding protein [Operophtera brumata]|uniref:Histone RNA hairpin-binding protein n=1 Tax=Operophtera brumata TaxID=104452 RepID=A0A0L7LG01_OPEBR|nr:Histone RNA hairpin-binding protein [Operophtera brumata]